VIALVCSLSPIKKRLPKEPLSKLGEPWAGGEPTRGPCTRRGRVQNRLSLSTRLLRAGTGPFRNRS